MVRSHADFILSRSQIFSHRISLILTINYFQSEQDWFVPSPALPIPEGGLALNKDQIRETLNYFRKYQNISSIRTFQICEIPHSVCAFLCAVSTAFRHDHDDGYVINRCAEKQRIATVRVTCSFTK